MVYFLCIVNINYLKYQQIINIYEYKKKFIYLNWRRRVKRKWNKTFREKDGLWENYKIEDVCTVEAFIKDPNFVNNFYNERRSSIIDQKILPNEAHYL